MSKTSRIPLNWVEVPLDEIIPQTGVFCDGDWVESKDQDPNGDVRLIQLADIGDGKFVDKSDRYLTKNKARELNCTFLEAGDLLIARMPDPLGRSCVFPLSGHEKYVTVVDVCIIRVSEVFINSKFLMYLINSPYVREQIEGYKSGSTRKRISRGNLAKVVLTMPPLNEQKRIVAKIEELFSELDKGIENLKIAREQLKVYRQSVLKHIFEQKGGRKTTLGELLSYITSGSRGWAEYYCDSGELFIRAQNLKYDRLDLTECAYVSIPNKTEGTRTKVEQGDLLITITGANVTKSALIEQDLGTAYVSQHVALCRPIKEVFPKFLYWFVIAEAAGRKQLSSAAYGAGKPGLNLDNIKSVQVTIPVYKQQMAVVKTIEEKLSVCEELEQEVERNIQKSEALRQSILKKAFSGKLVAQDPNDEPASVLLERIRTEKEAQTMESKKPKVKRNVA